MEKYPLVRVMWEDSARNMDWWTDMPEGVAIPITTVGFLLKETENAIVVAPHLAVEPFQHCGTMTIPLRSITERVLLEDST